MGKKHSVTSEGQQIWHQRDSMKRLVLIPRLSDIFRMTEKKKHCGTRETQTFNLPSTDLENVENENNLLLPGCEPTVSTNTDNNLEESAAVPDLDPAKWKINSSLIDYFILNQPIQDVKKINFNKTGRMCGKYFRKLPSSIFIRTLHNGQITNREWLLYSLSANALFCFQCLLFSNKKSNLGNLKFGLKNWGKCEEKVKCHEEGQQHGESIRIWFSRTQKTATSIDKMLHEEMKSKSDYWTNVLHRVIATITFLAERGLPFRGKNNEFGSVHNGNYMGCLELIAKFDPFLSGHISK
ncbi:zinc finger MYM-type protein 5-like [Sipha flava]|uniref:Zinc finger MYM-type protein 5-like n=1 Tax=Sipha flava TaxID=143950 RepID=A0A8B8FP51_9HEMI|nr:zinc finger MYM-type protein 5-like [Sipha flava]